MMDVASDGQLHSAVTLEAVAELLGLELEEAAAPGQPPRKVAKKTLVQQLKKDDALSIGSSATSEAAGTLAAALHVTVHADEDFEDGEVSSLGFTPLSIEWRQDGTSANGTPVWAEEKEYYGAAVSGVFAPLCKDLGPFYKGRDLAAHDVSAQHIIPVSPLPITVKQKVGPDIVLMDSRAAVSSYPSSSPLLVEIENPTNLERHLAQSQILTMIATHHRIHGATLPFNPYLIQTDLRTARVMHVERTSTGELALRTRRGSLVSALGFVKQRLIPLTPEERLLTVNRVTPLAVADAPHLSDLATFKGLLPRREHDLSELFDQASVMGADGFKYLLDCLRPSPILEDAWSTPYQRPIPAGMFG